MNTPEETHKKRNVPSSLARIAQMMREHATTIGHEGIDIQQADGHVLVKSIFSSEEQEAWRKEAAAYLEDLPSSMADLATEIEAEILRFDPLDTIAHIAWINTLHDAENWDEHQFEGNDAFTEYITLLCLTHPIEDFTQESLLDCFEFDGRSIQDKVKRLFQMSALQDQLEPLKHQTAPTVEEELRFLTLAHEVGVRYPGSTEHLRELLRGLLSPVSDRMTSLLGFSVEDAVDLDSGLFDHINEKLTQRLRKALEFEKDLRKAVKRYRQRRRLDKRFDEEMLVQLSELRPSESARAARQTAVAWAFFAFGQTLSFSAEELATATGVSEGRTAAFLNLHSVEFGSVGSRFRLPQPTHPLQQRPLIRFADGHEERYLCPVLQSVAWSIRPRFEEWLDQNAPSSDEAETLKRAYFATRSEYCERKAFELLAQILRPKDNHAHMGARYLHSVDGEEREFEIDGIILLDSALVLLEVKSGGFRPSARRGGVRSMRSDLESLVGYASDQTNAAWEFLSTSANPTIVLSDGRSWTVPMDTVERVFRICVTLEDLTVFATNIHNLADLGLVNLDTPYWAVSIYDLLVLRDLIELPAIFLHYLTSRYAIEKAGCVHGYCELDHLGCYLMGEMPYSGIPDEATENTRIILDPTYSSVIDNWYFYLQGARRTKPRKPERTIPWEFKAMLEGLNERRPKKHMEMSLLLLNLSDTEQAFLAHELGRIRKLSNKDQQRHDFTIVPAGWGLGITLLASYSDKLADLAERLETYCIAKKHQQKCNLWIGIGSLSWADDPVRLVVVLDNPWEPDPTLDDLVERLLPPTDSNYTD